MLFALLAFLVGAPCARADTFFVPWVGPAFGSSLRNGGTAVGASFGGMGAGVIGGEIDFGYNPDVFVSRVDIGDNAVATVAGNLLIGIPVGGQHGIGIRPYFVGGIGFMHGSIRGIGDNRLSSSDNMLGWDAGTGLLIFFADHVGMRGDLRYLRGTDDLDGRITSFELNGAHLRFWRASMGLVIR